MPPFVLSALALLGRGAGIGRSAFFGTPGRAALTGLGVGGLLPSPEFGIPGVDLFPDRRRRRRRRRALTAQDRADIGFLTALLGKTAGKELAIQIVTR